MANTGQTDVPDVVPEELSENTQDLPSPRHEANIDSPKVN